MSRTVLVVNSGSSSFKFALVDPDTGRRKAQGLALTAIQATQVAKTT
jgi:acetate kinase